MAITKDGESMDGFGKYFYTFFYHIVMYYLVQFWKLQIHKQCINFSQF